MTTIEQKPKKFAYYPGCTLKSQARNFEIAALGIAKQLGIEFDEIDDWTCCGTMYSLASDDKMKQVAPIRNIIRAQSMGHDQVMTLCSMCYNTMESSNQRVQLDTDMKTTLNEFMDDEPNYHGDMKIRHFLEYLKYDYGWNDLSTLIVNSIGGMKIASYYGCALVRPRTVAIDDPEQPQILEELIEIVGGIPIYYPYSVECCGSYNTVNYRKAVIDRTYKIINAARRNGAEALVLSCPLCDFNLDEVQQDTMISYPDFTPMPVFYFTQLLGLAMGLTAEECGLDKNYTDPSALLLDYQLIGEEIRRKVLK